MLGSPSVKRKIVSDQDEEKQILSLPITKKTPKKPSSDVFNRIDSSLEKNLHEELLAIFKTKKNRDKMITIVEQTFRYRRSIIENGSSQFLDLLNQFKYLTDVNNVRENFFIF
jgi:hypothetical protein